MEEKQISEQESLQLIQQMISVAKQQQKDDGKGWIIWGWMLFCASLLTVANLHYQWFQAFFFWNLFGGISFLFFLYSLIAKAFNKKGFPVKTYTGDLFSKLNTGFFISLLFIIMAMNIGARQAGSTGEMVIVRLGFALLINLYAFWILIYGTALNFRPSVIGAYLSWAIGFAALFVKTFEQVMLLQALAVLVGYIIPGYIANSQFKKLQGKDKVFEGV